MRVRQANASTWMNQIATYGRQFNDILDIYEETELLRFPNTPLGTFNMGDINKIEYTIDSGLMHSEMQVLNVEINKDSSIFNLIKVNRMLRYKLQLLDDSGDVIDTCDYGMFIINKIEELEDKNSVLLTCYDFMIRFMKEYHTPYYIIEREPPFSPVVETLTYPSTILNYTVFLQREFKMGSTSFNNLNNNHYNEIEKEHYLDSDGKSLGYTFRDVLDDICESLGCRLKLATRETNNGTQIDIEMRFDPIAHDPYIIVKDKHLKEKNVKVGKKIGPYNTLIIEQDENTQDIIYPQPTPQNSIPIKISNNPILTQSNKDDFVLGIYNNISIIEYYENDFSSTGVCLLESGEIFTLRLDSGDYKCLLLHDNLKRTTGLVENIHTTETEDGVAEYEYSSDGDKVEVNARSAYIKASDNKNSIINIINGSQTLDSLNVTGDAVIGGNINAHYFRSYNSNDVRTAVMGNSTSGGWMRLVDNNNANKLDMASTYLTFYDNSWNSTFNVDGTTGNTTIGGSLFVDEQDLKNYTCNYIENADLNDYDEPGIYYFGNCSNAPATYCYVIVMGRDGRGDIVQVAFDMGSSMWRRCKNSGTWTSWYQMISESYGTWTPTLANLNGNNPIASYTSRTGTWCVHGSLLYIDFYIRAKITNLNGGDYACITGVPFNIGGGFGQHPMQIGILYDAVNSNDNTIKLVQTGSMIRLQGGYGSYALQWKVTPGSYMEVGGSGVIYR